MKPYKPSSRKGLADAVFRNFSFMLELLSSTPQFQRDVRDDNVLYSSRVDFPFFNGVYASRLDENVDARIDECLAIFKKRKVSAYWWIDPLTRPSALGDRLRTRGLTASKSPAMARRLAAWRDPQGSGATTIHEVRTDGELRSWNDVFCRSFEMAESMRRPYLKAFRAIGLDRRDAIRYYTARSGRRTVGCAQLICGNGVAGLWGIGVLENARKRGAGAALTARCLTDARALGYETAILTSSDPGFSLYKKMGFETVCEYSHYLFTPKA